MSDPRPVPPAELERRVASAIAASECIITPAGDVVVTGRAPFALTDTSMSIPAETILSVAASIAADALARLRELQRNARAVKS